MLEPKYHRKWGSGVLFIGSKGNLLAGYGNHQLLPEEAFKDFERPAPFIPKSIGHHAEWILACKTGSPTTCNFGYAGMLTETILLGNLAYRTGRRVEWDATGMRTRNGADALIRRDYRKGWSLS